MLNFAYLLSDAIEGKVEDSVRQKLKNNVEKVAQQHKVQLSKFSKTPRNNKVLPYLLIIIDAECMIKGYLYYKRLNDNEWEIEPIDINDSQKGGKVEFNKLETPVELFIRKSEEILDQKTNEFYELTIEFFLPCKYWYEEIEKWSISLLLDNISGLGGNKNKYLIGEEYKVVVRSYERLIFPKLRNSLRGGIERLNKLREDLNSQILEDAFEYLDELNDPKCNKLKHKLKEKIGLKLICSESVSDEERRTIFQAIAIDIISSGIPIIIWTRYHETTKPNLQDAIEQIITFESLADFNILFQEVQKKRKYGYNLGILFEEPVLDPDFLRDISSCLTSYT